MREATPEVAIEMEQDTLDALDASGCFVYGMLAVRSADAAGRPLVWLQSRAYAMHMRVQPPDDFLAFTSAHLARLAPGPPVRASFHAPVEPGQTLVVARAGGGGEARDSGMTGAISLLNETDAPLTCGLACQVEGGATPLFAAPLYGGWLQMVTPLRRLLLFVSPHPALPGSVATISMGPGVLVELPSLAGGHLKFDVNLGWSWPDGVRARTVPAQTDLVPLLVEYPETA